jgi:hypothetical protein
MSLGDSRQRSHGMSKALSLMVATVTLVGCASQAQLLDASQPTAMQTAVARGRFNLSCPTAQGVLLSREVVEPALQGPYVAGIQRYEYTVGVDGCGKRSTYVVICPQGGTGCFAAGPGAFVPGR